MVVESLTGLRAKKTSDLRVMRRDLVEADGRGSGLSPTLRRYLWKIERELARRAGKQ